MSGGTFLLVFRGGGVSFEIRSYESSQTLPHVRPPVWRRLCPQRDVCDQLGWALPASRCCGAADHQTSIPVVCVNCPTTVAKYYQMNVDFD